MPAQTVIKLRRDSAADWASVNPVLADGEVGLESDSGLVKYGNGTSQWSDLPYTTAASVKTKVQNNTGSSIPKGSVVYISGASGDNPRITLADADTEATSSKTLGITEAAIADGAQGYVIESGLITGLNTAAATAGQSVWLSSTAGEFVFNAPPAKPAHSVYLGVVIRAHASQGAILVKVQNGYELNELHDVNIDGTPADNEVLAYNSASSMWINKTAAEAGLATASHTHVAADISNLGTGVATFLTNPTSENLRLAVTGETGTGNLVYSNNPTFGAAITVVGSGSNVSIGRFDGTAATPFIDFNSGATVVDYDSRIIATGGNGTAGNGTLQVLAGTLNLPATTNIGSVSATELSYLDGVTSAIQTQLDGKAAVSHTHLLADVTDVTATATELNVLDGITATTTELNYVDGVTSAIQTQLDSKSPITQAVSDKSANYTLQSSDVNSLIRSTNAAITITVPDVLSNGQRIDFLQAGTGQITFAGSGITINSADAKLKTAKQYAGATVLKAGGAYYLIGNLG